MMRTIKVFAPQTGPEHFTAIQAAHDIAAQNTPSARWIASDALREFQRVPPKDVPRKTQRADHSSTSGIIRPD